MRILLTGAAGFIGTAIDAQLSERGDRGGAGRRADPRGARPWCRRRVGRPPARRTRCGPVGRPARRRRRGLSPGGDGRCRRHGGRPPVVRRPQRPRHRGLLAAMADRGVGALVIASSMVVYGEGRYACAEHGEQQPPARDRAALESGDFENHCSTCQEPLDLGAGAGGRTARPAEQLRREQGRAGALRAGLGAAGRSTRDRLEVPQRLRAGDAARHSLLRGRRDLPVVAGARKAPRVFEDGGQMRDFVHVHDVARANLLAIDAVAERPAESWAAYNVCSGTPVPIVRIAELLSEAADGPAPEVTGDYRAGDVRHVVASPELAGRGARLHREHRPRAGHPGVRQRTPAGVVGLGPLASYEWWSHGHDSYDASRLSGSGRHRSGRHSSHFV